MMLHNHFVALPDEIGACVYDARSGRRTALVLENGINARWAASVAVGDNELEYLLVANESRALAPDEQVADNEGVVTTNPNLPPEVAALHGTTPGARTLVQSVTYRLKIDSLGSVEDLSRIATRPMAPGYQLPGVHRIEDAFTSPDGSRTYRTVTERDSRGEAWTCLVETRRDSTKRRVIFREQFNTLSGRGKFAWHTPCLDRLAQYILLFQEGHFYRIELDSGEFDCLPFVDGEPHHAAW